MVKVEMPRASWDIVIYQLSQDREANILNIIAKDIENQVYSQEY